MLISKATNGQIDIDLSTQYCRYIDISTISFQPSCPSKAVDHALLLYNILLLSIQG